MNILAIESSCDDTSVSLVKDGRDVMSLGTFSQIDKHKLFGGVVPEVASRCHLEAISGLTRIVVKDSGIDIKKIDAVAVTYAPGLIGSLLVGLSFAKGLSISLGVPLIPVHHIKAHVASNYLTNKELRPPFICLVVSGGHTSIINVKTYTQMEVIGRTMDDAAGEAFDKVARCLGFPYPGGVYLDKIAQSGDDERFQFPIPEVKGSIYDFSFSGLKTAAINKINNLKQKGDKIPVEDLAACLRKSVVSYLIKNIKSAMRDNNCEKIAIAGGVSANSLLRKELTSESKKNLWQLYLPELKFCGDNAAMVGAQAYYEFKEGKKCDFHLNAYASMNINEKI